MKKLFLIPLVFLGLLLSACSSISSGYVTSKEYHASYTYMTMQCSYYNSKGLCQSWIYLQHVMPEEWVLNLKDGDKTGWANVDPSTYEKYEVGDYFGRPISSPD